jgi:hypothetical protein
VETRPRRPASQSEVGPSEASHAGVGDTPKIEPSPAWSFLTTRLYGAGAPPPSEATSSAQRDSGAHSRSPAAVWNRSASTLLLILLLKWRGRSWSSLEQCLGAQPAGAERRHLGGTRWLHIRFRLPGPERQVRLTSLAPPAHDRCRTRESGRCDDRRPASRCDRDPS